MKTKLCDSYIEDIAAHVSGFASLSAEAAVHLRECAACRKKVAELKAIAAIQMDVAASLPEPKRRLNRHDLESALENSVEPTRSFAIWWRPILASAVALVVTAVVIFVAREPREVVRADPTPRTSSPATSAEPTMLALRNEVEHGREQLLARVPLSGGMQHYRVKDVEIELRN